MDKKMMIPFFDLKRQYALFGREVEQRVIDVMRSTAYIEGDATRMFEREMADYLGVRNVISCANGTDALRIALQAAGVQSGDEVITTPFTFFATAEAIAQIQATPVFADILEDTLNLDPQSVKKKISAKTKAILPVHIFGMPAEMDTLNKIAMEYQVPVIEDACQAIGSTYFGRKTGTLGDAGCFSFYPTKNLGAFGDGGMITTNDDDLAAVCVALKSHGAGKTGAKAYQQLSGERVRELEGIETGDALYDPCKYYNYLIGSNSRLDSIQAAVLSVKLRHLEKLNNRRREIAKKYTLAFDGYSIAVPQQEREGYTSCCHQYAVLVDEKERFVKHLNDAGIGTGAFYPVPLHLQRVFSDLGYKEGDLPVAEFVCSRSVCLPVFPELTGEEIEYVIDTVRRYH